MQRHAWRSARHCLPDQSRWSIAWLEVWILVGASLHLFPDHCFVDSCRRRDEMWPNMSTKKSVLNDDTTVYVWLDLANVLMINSLTRTLLSVWNVFGMLNVNPTQQQDYISILSIVQTKVFIHIQGYWEVRVELESIWCRIVFKSWGNEVLVMQITHTIGLSSWSFWTIVCAFARIVEYVQKFLLSFCLAHWCITQDILSNMRLKTKSTLTQI